MCIRDSNQSHHVGGGIGLISSRLNLEGPIVKDISSYLVTARRTYADLFLKLSKDDLINGNKLYFYDFNAKVNYRIDDKNRLYLSGYYGPVSYTHLDVYKRQVRQTNRLFFAVKAKSFHFANKFQPSPYRWAWCKAIFR